MIFIYLHNIVLCLSSFILKALPIIISWKQGITVPTAVRYITIRFIRSVVVYQLFWWRGGGEGWIQVSSTSWQDMRLGSQETDAICLSKTKRDDSDVASTSNKNELWVVYLFMVYFTTLSISLTTQRRMIRWLVNNELERIWMEVLVA
jgi:hypothetical protein